MTKLLVEVNIITSSKFILRVVGSHGVVINFRGFGLQ